NNNTYYLFSNNDFIPITTNTQSSQNIKNTQSTQNFSLMPLMNESETKTTIPMNYPLSYHNGILMTGNTDKGFVLKKILKHSENQNPVECIFFMDDDPDRIKQMDNAFSDQADIKSLFENK
ncbi:MAG: DUF2608 domain-containing protein, partial [Oligoflexia bacterium]|nr:DUF2608 domain-containing protein [Oligoflexia bacterium]